MTEIYGKYILSYLTEENLKKFKWKYRKGRDKFGEYIEVQCVPQDYSAESGGTGFRTGKVWVKFYEDEVDINGVIFYFGRKRFDVTPWHIAGSKACEDIVFTKEKDTKWDYSYMLPELIEKMLEGGEKNGN